MPSALGLIFDPPQICMDLGLKGVHVLVTGASGGIGLETTKVFLEQGANVTAHFRTSPAALQPLFETYGGARIHAIAADLTAEVSVTRLFELRKAATGPAAFGPVQVLVANHGAATAQDVHIVDMGLGQWHATLESNLTSTFLICREFLRQLPHGHPHAAIVLVGSTAGKYGELGNADYAASKSAIMYGLMLSLKNEIVRIAPRGRVNCVAPGWTRTPMAEHMLAKPPDVLNRALATTPLKKIAEPADVAKQIVMLASPTVSGHVTGQIVMVDGGMEGRVLNPTQDVAPQ